MIKIKSTDFKKLQNGELSIEQVADNLLAKYPVKEVAIALVEALSINDTPATRPAKISITKEEFEQHFRFIGFNEDGTVSTRGRKPKQK